MAFPIDLSLNEGLLSGGTHIQAGGDEALDFGAEFMCICNLSDHLKLRLLTVCVC